MIEDLRQEILKSRLNKNIDHETHQCLYNLWFILLRQNDESDKWKRHLSQHCLEKVNKYLQSINFK